MLKNISTEEVLYGLDGWKIYQKNLTVQLSRKQ